MNNKLKLIIITPEKPVLDKEIDFAAMPAYEGEMGVLPGHAPCVVELKEGILRYKSSGEQGEFAIMGGFAEVFDNKISVFAESAELAEEIDIERARQAAARAKAALSSKDKSLDLESAQASIRRALIRLKLAKRAKKHI